MIFTVRGPHEVPFVAVKRRGRRIDRSRLDDFWAEAGELCDARGCYIVGVRAGRGLTPLYIGKSSRGFRHDLFATANIRKYDQALAGYGRGTPVILFLVQSGRDRETQSISELERFLIQTASIRNPQLLNVKGVRRQEWGIAGVYRSPGRQSEAAKVFAAMLDL